MELPNLKTMTQGEESFPYPFTVNLPNMQPDKGNVLLSSVRADGGHCSDGLPSGRRSSEPVREYGNRNPGGKFRLTGEDGREIKEAGTTA